MKIAVAGLGFGAQVHVPGWRQIKGCEVVGVCASRPEKAQEVATKLQIPRAYIDWRELLADRPDVLSLALPPGSAEEPIAEALKLGIPVLTEKPLASSAARAQALEALAKQRGIPTAVGFQFLELPAFKKTQELLPSLGKIQKVSLDWQLESYAMKNRIWSWKTDASRGGGVLNALGSHFLYLFEAFLKIRYSQVQASASNQATGTFAPDPRLAAEDLIELKFSSEVRAAPPVHALITNSNPKGGGHRWEFQGERGTLILHNPTSDYMAGFYVELKTPQKTQRVFEDSSRADEDGRLAPFVSLARRFVDHIQKRSLSFTPSFLEGARVQEWMEKIRAQI